MGPFPKLNHWESPISMMDESSTGSRNLTLTPAGTAVATPGPAGTAVADAAAAAGTAPPGTVAPVDGTATCTAGCGNSEATASQSARSPSAPAGHCPARARHAAF